MPTTEPPRARTGPSWLGARWLLIGLLLAGVLGMHVLSQHDSSGGHGLVVNAVEQPAAPGQPAQDQPSVVDFAAQSVPDDPAGVIAACVLALVVVVGLALLLLGQARRVRHSAGRFVFDAVRRGPPGTGPSRLSLCVLRV